MVISAVKKEKNNNRSFAYNQQRSKLEDAYQFDCTAVTGCMINGFETLFNFSSHTTNSSAIILPWKGLITGDSFFLEVLSLYRIEDEAEIKSFLLENIDILDLLKTSYVAIQQIFGNCKVRLEIFDDPEEDTRKLIAVILSSLNPEAALNKLREFDDNFLLNILPQFREKFNVTVELT